MNLNGLNTASSLASFQLSSRRRELSLNSSSDARASLDLSAQRPPCRGGDTHLNLSNDAESGPSLSVESNRPSRREHVSALQAAFGF